MNPSFKILLVGISSCHELHKIMSLTAKNGNNYPAFQYNFQILYINELH